MKQLRSWHLSALKVISGPMSALARTSERDGRTRTTIENCAANESWTRTKYTYDSLSRLTGRTYSNKSLMPDVCTTVPNNTAANVCNNYDQGGAAAFALGRKTSVSDPSGS